MTFDRRGPRRIAASVLALAILVVATAPASAQRWPERPIRLIVPFPPGTASDTVFRLLAEGVAQRLGKPFIVDNRPGANAIIGTEMGARATPDGYTMVSGGNTTHAANPNLYKSLPYDPIRDFAPLAFICGLHYYLVVGVNHPARNVQELIAYAKANPSKLTYGAGNASTIVAAELFKLATGLDFTQVNYKGNPAAAADVIGGSLTMMFLDTSVARPLLQSKKLRPLGIATSKRSENFPDVPTLAEAGFPGIDFTAWIAMWYPAKTPAAIVKQANAEINAVLALPHVQQRLKDIGFALEGPGTRPEDLDAFVRREIDLWARVVREAKIPRQ